MLTCWKMEIGITSFFNFYTKLAESSFLCRFRIESVNVLFNSTIRFVPCAFFINKQFRTCANAFPNEFTVRSYEYARVNIEFFTGCKKIKQRRISFILGYLRMILWKISTAISIKHRILATFNMKKKNQFWQPLKER
jgi:hypothetical protein